MHYLKIGRHTQGYTAAEPSQSYNSSSGPLSFCGVWLKGMRKEQLTLPLADNRLESVVIPGDGPIISWTWVGVTLCTSIYIIIDLCVRMTMFEFTPWLRAVSTLIKR